MDYSTINYFAVLAAAVSTFVLGGLWYSPMLFGKAWMRANNFTETRGSNLQQGADVWLVNRLFAGYGNKSRAVSWRPWHQRNLGHDCWSVDGVGLGGNGDRHHRRL